MDETAGIPDGNPPPSSSLCDECRESPWKYRCPGCSIRTCSLPCVKAHKHRTACTGQKDRSVVVPLPRFDDNLLLSDYNFLEDAKRATEAARRGRRGIGRNCSFPLPPPLRCLRNAANRRRTRLLVLPYGMSKRANNRSRFDKRSNSISWTIEWRFHSTNVVLVDHWVNEHMNISSVIKKHLKPSPWKHQLKAFCNEQVENLRFYLQKNPKGTKSLFRELNTRIAIGKQMADIVVVEYPVIYICLPSHSFDFEVEKCAEPFSTNVVKSTGKPEIVPSPKGIVFREEEIEDDETSETHVLDVTRHTETEAPADFQDRKEKEIPNNAFLSDTRISVFASSKDEGQNLLERNTSLLTNNDSSASVGWCFDVEQDARDACSDLIGDINMDDYLCLDGFYSMEGEKGEEAFLGDLGDKLEEGEIRN